MLCFIATTFACGDKDDGCGERKDAYYYLSADAKSKIPYTGTDTLVFVSNTGDTARCIGQGTQVAFEEQNDGGICPSFSQYEVNSTSYVGDLNIEISLPSRVSDLSIIFNNILFYRSISVIGNDKEPGYLFEYVINNKTFNHVHVIKNKINNEQILIYSISYGILQVNDGKTIWNRL